MAAADSATRTEPTADQAAAPAPARRAPRAKTAPKPRAPRTGTKAAPAKKAGDEPDLDGADDGVELDGAPEGADLEEVEVDLDDVELVPDAPAKGVQVPGKATDEDEDDEDDEDEPANTGVNRRGPRERSSTPTKSSDFVWDEEESEALRQARKDAELTASADSVRAYLKQIGKVALLNAEEEVDLAKRIEAGLYAAERLRQVERGGREALAADAPRPQLDRPRRRARQEPPARGQPAPRGLAGQALHRPRHGVPGPDPGGQPRPDPRGREVRLHQGLQVLDLRHLVDPAGHHPRHGRPGPHHPHPGAHGRGHQQARPHPARAAPGPGPRAHAGRAGQGDGHHPGEGAGDPAVRPGADLPRPDHRRRGRQPARRLHRGLRGRRGRRRGELHAAAGPAASRCWQTLSEREAGVVRLRFGLTDGQPRTLDEIGQVYGVTRERIRQIESKTMSKLRHPSRSQVLRDYLD